jgi:16S rRNA (cytosine1402-N4)-methyltransferase
MVIGVDRDDEAIRAATQRLSHFGGRFRAVQAHFKEIGDVLTRLGIDQVSGILVDLGVSSMQLEQVERGFSFQHEGPLDMRMDRRQTRTAADLVNTLPEKELADLIYRFGEERSSRRIARAIVHERARQPIETTTRLAAVVARACRGPQRGRIHPATRTFQALRIAVNNELEGLDTFIKSAIDLLKPEGRLAVISFHSLEDRIIKRSFRLYAGQCQCSTEGAFFQMDTPQDGCPRCGAQRLVQVITFKPVTPTETEVIMNPRARSAKLRAVRKLSS